MIIKRILIILLFLTIGCLIGVFVAKFLRDEYRAPDYISILAICLFIAVFIGLAQLTLMKTMTPAQDFPTIAPRQAEIHGWIVPRNESSKSGFPLNKDRITIGRDVKNDILLNDDSVSREHVEVLRTADTYMIKDLKSKNGLYVNNQRVQEHLLQEGDAITIGDLSFFFRFSRKPTQEETPPEVPG
jgi:hypothetical protein